MEWPSSIKAAILQADTNPHALIVTCRDLYDGPDQPGKTGTWFQERYLDRRQSDGPQQSENVKTDHLKLEQENVTAHQDFTIRSPGLWATKKRICRYTNRTAGMLDHIAASVLKNRPKIEGPSDYWATLNSNVDGSEEDFIAYLRRHLQEILVGGRSYIGIVPDENGDLRLSFLPRVQITERTPNWIKTFRKIPIREHPWSEVKQVRYLYSYFTKEETAEYESVKDIKEKAPPPNEEVKLKQVRAHELEAMPLEPVEILQGLWAMKRLKDPALKLYNIDSAIAYSIWRCSYPAPFIKTNKKDIREMHFGEEVIAQLEPNDDVGFFASPSEHFNPAFKERDQARKDHYEVFASMAQHAAALATQNPRQAAAAKEMDREPFTLLLQSIADGIRESVERSLKRIAVFRNEDPEKVKVTGLDDFSGEGKKLESALKGPEPKEPESGKVTKHLKMSKKLYAWVPVVHDERVMPVDSK